MSIFLKISWCLPPDVKQHAISCTLTSSEHPTILLQENLLEKEDKLQDSYDTFAREPPGERGQTMGLLRLTVLGTPEVFHNESRLTFALRKAQALLLYLAVEGGLHSRSHLAALLWPDSEPHAARTALRNALTLLRRLLADRDPSAPAPSHLLSDQELLGLDPQTPLALDLEVVQQAYRAAQRHSTLPCQEQRAALVTQMQHALALVRGPFLEGFWLREESGFDAWVQQQQQQWQVRLQLLFDRLSAFQESGGGVGAAPPPPPPRPGARAPAARAESRPRC